MLSYVSVILGIKFLIFGAKMTAQGFTGHAVVVGFVQA